MWLEIIKAGGKVPIGIPQASDREVDRQIHLLILYMSIEEKEINKGTLTRDTPKAMHYKVKGAWQGLHSKHNRQWHQSQALGEDSQEPQSGHPSSRLLSH